MAGPWHGHAEISLAKAQVLQLLINFSCFCFIRIFYIGRCYSGLLPASWPVIIKLSNFQYIKFPAISKYPSRLSQLHRAPNRASPPELPLPPLADSHCRVDVKPLAPPFSAHTSLPPSSQNSLGLLHRPPQHADATTKTLVFAPPEIQNPQVLL